MADDPNGASKAGLRLSPWFVTLIVTIALAFVGPGGWALTMIWASATKLATIEGQITTIANDLTGEKHEEEAQQRRTSASISSLDNRVASIEQWRGQSSVTIGITESTLAGISRTLEDQRRELASIRDLLMNRRDNRANGPP